MLNRVQVVDVAVDLGFTSVVNDYIAGQPLEARGQNIYLLLRPPRLIVIRVIQL